MNQMLLRLHNSIKDKPRIIKLYNCRILKYNILFTAYYVNCELFYINIRQEYEAKLFTHICYIHVRLYMQKFIFCKEHML